MNISEFISQMEERRPPASEKDLVAFEAGIGCRLPEDYRQFLRSANGGSVLAACSALRRSQPSLCLYFIGLRNEVSVSLTKVGAARRPPHEPNAYAILRFDAHAGA
jgi:hypothetical protein